MNNELEAVRRKARAMEQKAVAHEAKGAAYRILQELKPQPWKLISMFDFNHPLRRYQAARREYREQQELREWPAEIEAESTEEQTNEIA